MKNKRTIINLFCSLSVLAIGIGISFVLSPFIVKSIGVEANGFVTLANNFVGYANIIVIALNGMAARYISISYHQKDYNKANVYYNSVFWGNIILLLIITLPVGLFLFFLDSFIDIPKELVFDVKLLFSLIFGGFYLQTGFPNYDCGTYVTNRLDRTYVPRMIVALIRCLFLFLSFSLFTPHVWYVGAASALVATLLLIVEGHNTHKLTPELKISFRERKKLVSSNALKELVGTGIWNAISNVGKMLYSSFDLIICNLFLGAKKMGILSLSKILLTLVDELANSISRVFLPQMTIYYAENNNLAFNKSIIKSMKIMSVLLTIPLAIIIVYGEDFYTLWIPSQDAKLLNAISILAISSYFLCSGSNILMNAFTVINKVKANSIAIIVSGALSIITTIMLLSYTSIGIYAVAGISSIFIVLKDIIFTVPYLAHFIEIKKKQIYLQMILTALSSTVLVGIGMLLKHILRVNNWGSFIISILIYSIIALIINMVIQMNRNDIRTILTKFRKKGD